jgi:hypothetical protein
MALTRAAKKLGSLKVTWGLRHADKSQLLKSTPPMATKKGEKSAFFYDYLGLERQAGFNPIGPHSGRAPPKYPGQAMSAEAKKVTAQLKNPWRKSASKKQSVAITAVETLESKWLLK